MKKSVRFILALTGLMFVIALTAAPAPKRSAPDASQQAKGRYYFLHATNIASQENGLLDAYELYRKAYAADPDNDAIAFNYALLTYIMRIPFKDSITMDECIAIMRRYVDKYPGDVQSCKMYANLEMNIQENFLEAARVYNNILRANPDLTDTYLELWNAYARADMTDSAIWALERYEQIEGPTERTTYTKIITMMDSGDTTAMINTAKQYVYSKPLDSDAWVLLGTLYDAFEMQDSAMMVMQKAIDVAPTASRPKSEMAKLCLAHGDTVRADSLMAMTMHSTDLTTADKAAMLNDFLETLVHYKGDLHRALPLVAALLSDDPENEDAWEVKTRVHWTLNEWPEAIAAARRLSTLNPASEDIWVNVLTLLANGKQFSDLDSTYAQIKEYISAPSHVTRLLYTSALIMAGRNREALDFAMNEIRTMLPDYTLPAPRKPGDPFAPLTPEKEVDSIAPMEISIVEMDSTYFDENGVAVLPNDTITAFSECFAIPDSLAESAKQLSDWMQMAADQYVALGDTAQGFAIYDQALCLNPRNTLVLNNYAYFLALRGQDLDRAYEMSYAAVSADPSATNIDTYAYVLFRQRNYEGAKLAMSIIFENEELKNDDLSAEVYEHYGDILFMVGDPAGALTNWKQALSLDPDNELLQRKVKNETFFYK